jgi:hypothetical protein
MLAGMAAQADHRIAINLWAPITGHDTEAIRHAAYYHSDYTATCGIKHRMATQSLVILNYPTKDEIGLSYAPLKQCAGTLSS